MSTAQNEPTKNHNNHEGNDIQATSVANSIAY